MSYCDTPSRLELDRMEREEYERSAMGRYRDQLAEWVIERWDAEVKSRPARNVHRKMLDETWRQVYRRLTGAELPR